ncbi:MAG: hypothetical protein Q4G26_14225 [Paracoccus sp. (in: a-proteobacteria)]|nr:hypothetical protein [Paracoccus sp. (in: a-proteobacteria)]
MTGIFTKAAIGAVALLGLSACVPEGTDTAGTAQPLANCGRVATSQMASYTEAPITAEGGGMIGIGTQQQSADGSVMQRFSLVDCSARTITRVQQDWTLASAPAAGNTLQDMVNRLRQSGRLTASNQLARTGQAAGYAVTQGRVDAVGNPRARCGCELHYPDLLWQ